MKAISLVQFFPSVSYPRVTNYSESIYFLFSAVGSWPGYD